MVNSGQGRLPDKTFWSKQRVFLTGHSGFKGAWLSLWLEHLGAEVYGLSLPPETTPNLFGLLAPMDGQTSEFGDIRNSHTVTTAVERFRPTVAIHMAAQPLVRRSFRQPMETFATNVMGTAHVLESLRTVDGLAAVLIITTDKVYRNLDLGRPFVEDDPLGGHDPYSASKAAAELATASWGQSYFAKNGVPVATARAGNVIGGGDWSEDRLVPDIWRASKAGKPVELRYPDSTRPWQHVLDPLAGYLAFVESLAAKRDGVPTALNFGPSGAETLTVGEVASAISYGMGLGKAWTRAAGPQPPEMKYLSLNAARATAALGWRPRLSSGEALRWTVDWYRGFDDGNNPRETTAAQIKTYEAME